MLLPNSLFPVRPGQWLLPVVEKIQSAEKIDDFFW